MVEGVTVIELVVAPVDHDKFPVLQEALIVTDVPLQTVGLLPLADVIVGAEGVFTTVATTAERLAPAVSQPDALSLHPT